MGRVLKIAANDSIKMPGISNHHTSEDHKPPYFGCGKGLVDEVAQTMGGCFFAELGKGEGYIFCIFVGVQELGSILLGPSWF